MDANTKEKIGAVVFCGFLILMAYSCHQPSNGSLKSEGFSNTSAYLQDDGSDHAVSDKWEVLGDPATSVPQPADYNSPSSSSYGYIKGNISSNGEKIYHMPGDRYYDATIIDESKGERWFSSPEEAEAAGWRRSYV